MADRMSTQAAGVTMQEMIMISAIRTDVTTDMTMTDGLTTEIMPAASEVLRKDLAATERIMTLAKNSMTVPEETDIAAVTGKGLVMEVVVLREIETSMLAGGRSMGVAERGLNGDEAVMMAREKALLIAEMGLDEVKAMEMVEGNFLVVGTNLVVDKITAMAAEAEVMVVPGRNLLTAERILVAAGVTVTLAEMNLVVAGVTVIVGRTLVAAEVTAILPERGLEVVGVMRVPGTNLLRPGRGLVLVGVTLMVERRVSVVVGVTPTAGQSLKPIENDTWVLRTGLVRKGQDLAAIEKTSLREVERALQPPEKITPAALVGQAWVSLIRAGRRMMWTLDRSMELVETGLLAPAVAETCTVKLEKHIQQVDGTMRAVELVDLLRLIDQCIVVNLRGVRVVVGAEGTVTLSRTSRVKEPRLKTMVKARGQLLASEMLEISLRLGKVCDVMNFMPLFV